MAGELHVLFCDETEVDRPSGYKFSITAGIVLKEDQIRSLCTLLTQEREQLGLQPTEPLKFSSKEKPERLTDEEWLNAKRAVLEGMASQGVALLAHIVLNNIAAKEGPEWAIDALVGAFDRLLECDGGCGIVIADHWKYKREDMADVATGKVGIYGSSAPYVMGVATAHVEAMMPLQLADLAVGALRFCLGRPDFDVSKTLFGYMRQMIWPGFGTADPPDAWFWGGGLELRPSEVMVTTYANEYKSLESDIRTLSEEASQ